MYLKIIYVTIVEHSVLRQENRRNMKMKRIKIGIADENKEFCEILVDYFKEKEDIDLAFVSHDGIKTIENIKLHQPEIFILDKVKPQLHG